MILWLKQIQQIPGISQARLNGHDLVRRADRLHRLCSVNLITKRRHRHLPTSALSPPSNIERKTHTRTSGVTNEQAHVYFGETRSHLLGCPQLRGCRVPLLRCSNAAVLSLLTQLLRQNRHGPRVLTVFLAAVVVQPRKFLLVELPQKAGMSSPLDSEGVQGTAKMLVKSSTNILGTNQFVLALFAMPATRQV